MSEEKKLNELSEDELKQIAGGGDGEKYLLSKAFTCPFCNGTHTFKVRYISIYSFEVSSPSICNNINSFDYTGVKARLYGINGTTVDVSCRDIGYETI